MRVAPPRALFILCGLLLVGCASPPPRRTVPATQMLNQIGLTAPVPVKAVDALCPAPQGWSAEPLKQSDKHNHQVWLSPTEKTAYGVIKFALPFPVPPEMVLPFFLQQMKESEGDAVLVEKHHDDSAGGLRFIADGGLYRVRSLLLTKGWQGWVIYAGTLRAQPEDPAELKLAEQARENTRVGTE